MAEKRVPTVLYQISFSFHDSTGKCSLVSVLFEQSGRPRDGQCGWKQTYALPLIEAFSILKLPVYVCPAHDKAVCCYAHSSLTNDWQKGHFQSNRHFLMCLGCTFAHHFQCIHFAFTLACCLSPESWKTCSICFSFSIQALSPSTLTQFPFAHLLWYLRLIVFGSHWHHLIKSCIPCVLLHCQVLTLDCRTNCCHRSTFIFCPYSFKA